MISTPFDWTAGPFLELYLFLAAVMLGWTLWRRSSIGPEVRNPRSLNELELALLGGEWRLGDAALFRLLEAKTASVGADGRIDVADQAPLAPFVGRLPPLPFAAGMTRGQFQSALGPLVDRLRARLCSAGYVPTDAEIGRFRTATLLAAAVLIAFGAIKVAVGASRGHPVGILVFLLIATALCALATMGRPALTQAGSDALRRYASRRAARAPLDSELLFAVALSGFAVLAGTEYAQALAATRAAGSGSGCSGGGTVGGSDGGGGGGGGGCSGGGGGCGGCGS